MEPPKSFTEYCKAKEIQLTPKQLRGFIPMYLESDFPGRRPATTSQNRGRVEKWVGWMEALHHRSVTYDNLQEYCTRVHNIHMPRTAQEYWGGVTRFLGWMERAGIVPVSPHSAIRRPKVRVIRHINPITREEYAKLREAASGHWMDWIILLGWNTGMSICDCMLLRWRDVDLDQCMIRIARLKSGSESMIPFDPTDELGRAIKQMRDAQPDADPDDFVSQDAGGRVRMDSADVSACGTEIFRRISARAGIAKGKGFHAMRHAFVSMLANSGMNTALASKVTGHISPAIFARYVHADAASLRKGVSQARQDSGSFKEVTVSPSENHIRPTAGFVFKPNTVYIVRRGRLRLPDGEIVSYVKTGASAEGRMTVVLPCDEQGTITAQVQLLVDIRDLRSFS